MSASNFLEELTGRPAVWWMNLCQQAVKEASKPSDDPNHDQTDVEAFLAKVNKTVVASMPPDGSGDVPYDGNMRAAVLSSMVLALWYGRVAYAKAHDPNRPVSLRIRAYKRWLHWAQALVTIPLDESEDAAFFPGQKWDFPFSIEAENGGFV